jgi:HD-GYP domain-containing protein (c-di-GMP phosphodiesterase class II)
VSFAKATGLMGSLVEALTNHDPGTRGHSERTARYAVIAARVLDLDAEDYEKLFWAAMMHDVGKLTVSTGILRKPGPLTAYEFDLIKRHPEDGMRLIEPIASWLGDYARGVGEHHERWDGGGYPRGLAGNEISLAARIISVVDAYEVMTTGRVYQERVSHAAAREEIAANSGTQFDPHVAEVFLSLSRSELAVEP